MFPPTTQVLEKTFYMENPDEIVPEKFVGCTIDWAAGKDTTGEGHNLSTGQRGGEQGRRGGAQTQCVYLGRRRGRCVAPHCKAMHSRKTRTAAQ